MTELNDLTDCKSDDTSFVFLGTGSGTAPSTGANNTAVGIGALAANAGNHDNTAVGYHALNANTSASPNSQALANTAVGSQALLTNTTGTDNVAIGYAAGSYNTTGSDNVMIGYNGHGSSPLNYDNTTSVGTGAIPTGTGGTSIGQNASAGLTAVALGLDSTASGTDSIAIGHSASASATNAIAIGDSVTNSTANTVKIGNSSVTAVYFGAAGTTLGTDVALAGNPTTTTQSAGNNSTRIATTAYVDAAVSAGATGVAYNSIAGCLPSSMAGTHTTATMSVSAGQAADSTNAVYITGAGYSWAVSNGNAINGYQGGTTLPNSSTIHMYLCTGASGTGTFASTSLTPTLPTGYAVSYRRIFSFNTNGSGAPIPYTSIEAEGGSTINYLTTQVLDISTTTQGTSRILYTLSVPAGIKVEPIFRYQPNSSGGLLFTSPDETDVAPTNYGVFTVPLWDPAGTTVALGYPITLTTNTSGQIGIRGSTTGLKVYLATRGFKDYRRG